MAKDVIIIGGGIGGLVSACLLCKEGYKVTVLERHNKIGGGLHCFERFGVTFETGIHYISGFEEGGVLQRICNYLGIGDKIKLKSLDTNGFDILHVGSDNMKYAFGVGKENFVNLLGESFPDEKENISCYLDAVYNICSNIPLYNLQPAGSQLGYFKEEFLAPVGEFIAQFTQNHKLRDVLAWNNSLYAGDKEATPVYVHALVTKFYIEGATRFVGGSQQFANAMLDYIEANGGTVHTSTEVNQLIVEDKKITKVLTAKGLEFKGEYYISDIHPSVLLDMIEPDKIQRSYRERLQNIKNTYSAFIVFIALKPNTFRFLNHNYYYFKDYEKIWNVNKYDETSYPPGFMLTTPPSEGQGEFADRILLSCIMNYDDVKKWENSTIGKRGKDYEDFKQQVEDKMIDLAEQVFQGLRSSIAHVFSSTPLTISDYLGTKEGSLYGYKKDCRNIIKSQVMPRTKIENLLLTGQNINLHGIIGVPLNAILTVGELVGMNSLLSKINQYNKIQFS